MKEIQLTVDGNGNIEITKVTGYGKGCLKATSSLEQLGSIVEGSRKTTEELYLPEAITTVKQTQ